jgi:competence protein ComEA
MKFVLVFFLAVMATNAAAAADEPKLPPGPGKETTQKICGSCHGAEIVVGRKMTRDGWNQLVVNMIERGAQGSDDEFADIVDYLTNTVSVEAAKIHVNKASAKQLQSGLDISDTEAAAVLHYREEKGNFKSIEDLKKVPGLDGAKIDAKKSKLVFD